MEFVNSFCNTKYTAGGFFRRNFLINAIAHLDFANGLGKSFHKLLVFLSKEDTTKANASCKCLTKKLDALKNKHTLALTILFIVEGIAVDYKLVVS